MPTETQRIKPARGFAMADGLADEAAGTPITFTASTPGVKRDGIDLRASGWWLDNFRRNPVFQWCHDITAPPLGRVEAKVAGKLQAAVTFDQEDEFARKVESKYRRGFLNAVSVQWDFVDSTGRRLANWWRLSADELTERAFYDLLEISGVPVPADPDGLMQRHRTALRSLGRELLDLYGEQENPDSDVQAPELRAAVLAELTRLGVPLPSQDPAPAVPGIDESAARDVLAAFNLEGVS